MYLKQTSTMFDMDSKQMYKYILNILYVEK